MGSVLVVHGGNMCHGSIASGGFWVLVVGRGRIVGSVDYEDLVIGA